ncbi:hypothetical protein [Embleya sp. NPDC059259]|uniref:hypothetical protein n=1 Tax=unclassified Embleya TaxID=2699296 RepID=UPI0036AB6E9C
MTTSKSEPLQVTLSEKTRQALAAGTTPEAPTAAAEARDRLLRAIGREAQHVADTSAGEASTALAELARAYALVTTPPAIGARFLGDTPSNLMTPGLFGTYTRE